MKIIIFFLLLINTTIFAEVKLYVGSNYGTYEEKFTNEVDATSSTEIAKVKIGYGVREAYAIELSLEYIDNKSKIFSSDNSSDLDGDKYGLNVDLIKAFDLDILTLPYIKAGFGSGWFDIDRELQNRLFYSSFNLGTGIFIPINENFDLELGYEYKYISYESIDTIADKLNYESNINIAYVGFNVRF